MKKLFNRIEAWRAAKRAISVGTQIRKLLNETYSILDNYKYIQEFRKTNKCKYLEWFINDALDTDYVQACVTQAGTFITYYGIWKTDIGHKYTYKDIFRYLEFRDDIQTLNEAVTACILLIKFLEENPELTIRKK